MLTNRPFRRRRWRAAFKSRWEGPPARVGVRARTCDCRCQTGGVNRFGVRPHASMRYGPSHPAAMKQVLPRYFSFEQPPDRAERPGCAAPRYHAHWLQWRLLTLETRITSGHLRSRPGSRRRVGTRRQYSPAEKEQAVRLVWQLRAGLGTEHGTVQRVAGQLGYGTGSVRYCVVDPDVMVPG